MVETKIGVLAYFVEVGVIRCVHLYVFVCGCALAVANTGQVCAVHVRSHQDRHTYNNLNNLKQSQHTKVV